MREGEGVDGRVGDVEVRDEGGPVAHVALFVLGRGGDVGADGCADHGGGLGDEVVVAFDFVGDPRGVGVGPCGFDRIAVRALERIGAALLGGDEGVDALEGGVNPAIAGGEEFLDFVVVGYGHYDGEIAEGLDAGVGVRTAEVRTLDVGVPEGAFESVERRIHAEEVRV